MKILKFQYFCFILFFANSLGLHDENTRCRCICPSPAAVLDGANNERKLFIADVPPNKCNCDGVVLPMVGDEVKSHVQEYCPRCECKFESRDPSVIMFLLECLLCVVTMLVLFLQLVIFFLLGVIMLLLVYMGFLKLLSPLIRKRRPRYYQESFSPETSNLLEDMED